NGTFSYSNIIVVDVSTPIEFELTQNYPNPFNPTTAIRYSIPQDSKVTLEVFSVLGENVSTIVNEYQNAGSYTVNFNGSSLASGTYIYRLTANQTVITKKMLLMK
ncbi:MAG: T9SS type A sorting domain-containing protein, partial [Ignavibacteriaceae bacterium]|nr:T9SS type A sorting domain-containing protein [Ignavibacteriaceae bacterium]